MSKAKSEYAKVHECPFNQGDVVEHKASGQKAVVIRGEYGCTSHTQMQHLLNGMALCDGKQEPHGPCTREYTGRVTVSFGFDSEEITVDGFTLVYVCD